jgi:hypothetical protein
MCVFFHQVTISLGVYEWPADEAHLGASLVNWTDNAVLERYIRIFAKSQVNLWKIDILIYYSILIEHEGDWIRIDVKR